MGGRQRTTLFMEKGKKEEEKEQTGRQRGKKRK